MTLADVSRAGVALLSACAIWLVVNAEEPDAAWVPVTIRVALDSSVTLAQPLDPVHAFVVGRRRDLLRMLQSPPVLHQAVNGSAGDSIRIDVRASDLDLPNGSGARVSDIRPRRITVVLQPQ